MPADNVPALPRDPSHDILHSERKLGLGNEFLRRLLVIGCEEKLDRIFAVMAADNVAMRKIASAAGFQITGPDRDGLITARIELSAVGVVSLAPHAGS